MFTISYVKTPNKHKTPSYKMVCMEWSKSCERNIRVYVYVCHRKKMHGAILYVNNTYLWVMGLWVVLTFIFAWIFQFVFIRLQWIWVGFDKGSINMSEKEKKWTTAFPACNKSCLSLGTFGAKRWVSSCSQSHRVPPTSRSLENMPCACSTGDNWLSECSPRTAWMWMLGFHSRATEERREMTTAPRDAPRGESCQLFTGCRGR